MGSYLEREGGKCAIFHLKIENKIRVWRLLGNSSPFLCPVLCLCSSYDNNVKEERDGEQRVKSQSDFLRQTKERGILEVDIDVRTNLPVAVIQTPRWALWHFELIRNFTSLSLLCRVNCSDIALRHFIIMQSHLIRAPSSNLARSVKGPL